MLGEIGEPLLVGAHLVEHHGVEPRTGEAIDRGVPLEDVKPRNNISSELKKLIDRPEPAKTARRDAAGEKPRGLAWAR